MPIFMEHLLCTGYNSKLRVYVNSFISYKCPLTTNTVIIAILKIKSYIHVEVIWQRSNNY